MDVQGWNRLLMGNVAKALAEFICNLHEEHKCDISIIVHNVVYQN